MEKAIGENTLLGIPFLSIKSPASHLFVPMASNTNLG